MRAFMGLKCLHWFGEVIPRISVVSQMPSSSPPKNIDNRTHSKASAAGDGFFSSISFLVSAEQPVRMLLKSLRARFRQSS
jgi:hypothetical protein